MKKIALSIGSRIFRRGLLLALSIVLLALTVLLVLPSRTAPIQASDHPLAEKIIALDAGHGGTEWGAQYPANTGTEALIYEKDVNLAVVYVLKQELEAVGAHVVLTRECDETISSRKERVDIAIEKCKSQYGQRCDVLVSVHHNGSTDSSYDGMLVIYTEKRDLPLATALHDDLWLGLEHNPNGYEDQGLNKGGYGMTVYGHLVSSLTEAYYITNDWEAVQYLAGTPSAVCPQTDYSVLIGDRIDEEANALYQGLFGYFVPAEDAPPSVSIVDPVEGQAVSGNYRVLMSAGDDSAVAKVELRIDDGVYTDITVNREGDYYFYDWNTFDDADGNHTLQARATDDASQSTGSDLVNVTVDNSGGGGGISLTATGYKVRGLQKADLKWSGATSDIDVYRDGVLIVTTANAFYTDNIDERGGGSYTYQVCEEGTSTCSDEATVSF